MVTRNLNKASKLPSLKSQPPTLPPVSLPSFSQPDPPNSPPNDSHSQPEFPLEPTASHPVSAPPDWTPEDLTPTSTSGKRLITAEHGAKIVGGLLKIAIRAAEVLIARTTANALRRPTEGQVRDIATPTASLLTRYTNLASAPESLVDISDLATALSDYLLDEKPLVARRVPAAQHLGMPADDEPDTADDQPGVKPTVSFLP